VPWYQKFGPSNGPGSAINAEDYYSGTLHDLDVLGKAVPQRPVAAASSPEGEVYVAYLRMNGTDYFGSNSYKSCYRQSLNAGQDFNAEICDTLIGTPRYGLTIAHDPRSNAFLLSLAMQDQRIYVKTIPANGSATPQAYTLLDAYSWNAPSIACKNAVNGCRIAYEARTTEGCLTWIETDVNLTTGNVRKPGTTRQQCWLLQDTPSIVYFKQDDTFRLAYQYGNGAIYARSMTSAGTTWSGMPDIWNNSSSTVTSPALATEYWCLFGCSGTLRAWFTKFSP
jgi:hypothetical protein